MAALQLRIGHLYAEWMNLYGDRGNALVLVRRCQWRGIDATVECIGAGLAPDLRAFDILLLGGGSDEAQSAISRDLCHHKAEALREAVEDGVVLLAICGGYQLLGHFYRTADGQELPGIGLLDAYTVAAPGRLVGNVVAQTADGLALVGYENHSGRTYLGSSARPLARVVAGYGNNGVDRTEGAVYRHAFGTYLHGPLLPKNPHFADHLLRLALRRRYGVDDLAPLDDRLEEAAHRRAIEITRRRRIPAWWQRAGGRRAG